MSPLLVDVIVKNWQIIILNVLPINLAKTFVCLFFAQSIFLRDFSMHFDSIDRLQPVFLWSFCNICSVAFIQEQNCASGFLSLNHYNGIKMEMTVEVYFWQKLLWHKRHCDEKRCKLLLNFTFNSWMRSILYCALEANIFSSRRYFHLFHPKRLFHLFSFSVFQLLNF